MFKSIAIILVFIAALAFCAGAVWFLLLPGPSKVVALVIGIPALLLAKHVVHMLTWR